MDLNHRDLSYSAIARSPAGRATIRIIENLTGRPAVLWRMRSLGDRVAGGQPIWDAIWETFGLTLTVEGEFPQSSGPLLTIANHPYGLVDSLALCTILSRQDQPFHIVANDVFLKAGPIARHILPITFEAGRDATRRNLRTRDRALALLRAGHRVAMFPAGATAGPAQLFGRPYEVAWSSFAARLAMESGAQIVPIYFPIQRRPVFDTVGYLHPILRHALQINGFYRRMDDEVVARIGPALRIEPDQTAAAVTATLRKAVLSLGETDPRIQGRRF